MAPRIGRGQRRGPRWRRPVSGASSQSTGSGCAAASIRTRSPGTMPSSVARAGARGQLRVRAARPRVRGEVVAVSADLDHVVGEPGRHLAQRGGERGQREGVPLAGRTSVGRLGDPVGGGEEHVDRRPASGRRTASPADQQPSSTAAVCQCGGSSTPAGSPGAEADLVDEEVGGLGHPVRQRGAGQFGAVAGGVVVPGQQRSGRVGRDRVGEHPGNVVGHRRERYAPAGPYSMTIGQVGVPSGRSQRPARGSGVGLPRSVVSPPITPPVQGVAP